MSTVSARAKTRPRPTHRDSTATDEGESIVPLLWHKTVERLLCLDAMRMLCLVGEAGIGKTKYARHIARKLRNKEPVVINGSPECDLSSLWGRWTLKGAETVFVPAGLSVALTENRPLIVEDWGLIPLETRATCLGLDQAAIENPFTHELMSISDKDSFLLIVTSNEESLACRKSTGIAIVLWDRFHVVPIPDLSHHDLHQLLAHNLPQASEDLRSRAISLYEHWRDFSQKAESARKYLTFRALLRLGRLLHAGFEEAQAVELALINALLPMDKQLFDAAVLKQNMSLPAAVVDDALPEDNSTTDE